MIDGLKFIDNIDILHSSKITLYGAGYQGGVTLKKLREAGFAPAYFCDGNPQKWGDYIGGVEVLSPSALKQLDETEELAIIITSDQIHFIDQIVDDIVWLKLRTDKIFTLFGLSVSLVRNNRTAEINGGFYETHLKMQRDLYYVSEVYYYLTARMKWAEKPDVILVYASPKTGTITLENSLMHTGIYANRFHTFRGADLFFNPLSKESIAEHAAECLKMLKSRTSVKIITMVREPIARNLALIFQLLGHYEFKIGEMPAGKPFVSAVVDIMASRGGELFDSAHEPLNWFDNELNKVFGINVYAYPFDRENGYSIIKQGNIEVLIMKLEKLNLLERVIAEFVGAPRFKLVNANEADNKPYKYLYKQVRNEMKLIRETFDFYYNDPRMAHFYIEEEIAGFLKKWGNNIADK